jgi:hypothetical protein
VGSGPPELSGMVSVVSLKLLESVAEPLGSVVADMSSADNVAEALSIEESSPPKASDADSEEVSNALRESVGEADSKSLNELVAVADAESKALTESVADALSVVVAAESVTEDESTECTPEED